MRCRILAVLCALSACQTLPDSPPEAETPDATAGDSGVIQCDAGTLPDAGSVDGGATLRLMTWNAENLFDEVDDPKKEDTVLSPDEARSKLSRVASAIREQAPDIVALQETENLELLSTVGSQVGLPHVALVRSYDFRGINVGLASRFPITQTVSHLGEYLYSPGGAGPYRWARDCLEVHISAPNGALVVLVNHQTSKLDTAAGDAKRQAQSRRTREIADRLRAEVPTRPVFIVGDMNDEPPSPSVGLLVAGGDFVDVATDVPDGDRWTYVWQGPRRYDYLLPDRDTATRRLSVVIPHTAAVQAASDHAPIVATFGW